MSELITVCIVITLVVAGWLAMCIEMQGVKEGVKIAIIIPVLFIVIISMAVYIFYSFGVVIDRIS